ncbi:CDP-alcohol phosphatidyltransferase family protein [Galbibacter sp.]|uniref:CDP-alcohol phosphatidyltransferase family protein n=1 Tax=Galbibacter sp. TaxID=2918471 RepID=UPI002B829F6F|nr:CDP-alcohol phosphatidyltransferase family protein [Galbibacter sp.]HLV63550.1 CDP-alcohol phosphatidyltransferase family protein [Galbibacter sp.]
MKRYIPNALTLLNLSAGIIAVILAVQGNLVLASYFVFAGIFFDFFDGMAARLLHVEGELGLQLDSLADVVTSGVVPGIVLYQLFQLSLGENFIPGATILGAHPNDSFETLQWLPFFGILVSLGSAYRLAKFNIDQQQTTSFIGLPTPANALLILSLPLMLYYQPGLFDSIILNQWFLIALTIFSTYILNAKIPLFALKFKTWRFKDNTIRYVFLILALLLLILLQYAAIPLIIILYILLSVWSNFAKAAV